MTDVQAHLEKLAHDATDPAALAAVEDAYRGEGRWEELLRVYEENALRAAATHAAPMLRKAALVCLTELASATRAEAYLQRALQANPADVDALKALRELFLSRGDYERGIEVYERELARTSDPKEKAAGLIKVAHYFVETLGRSDKALSALRQAQKLDPENVEAHRLIAGVYIEQGRLDLADAAVRAELALTGATPELLGRMTVLAERLVERPKLHDLARAMANSVLEHRAGDGAAQAVLRELDELKTAWARRVTDLEQRAAELATRDRAAAAEPWLTIAELQFVYGHDADAALVSIDRALGGQPGHAVALRLLEEIYGAEERWDDLALKLEMMAAYARDPNVAVELYLKAALTHAVRLDDSEAAARVYQRVLQLDPGNKVASNALVEFYREHRRWNEAIEVLSAWAERATQASDKVAAHYGCARLLEDEFGDQARARPHYEAILALDPTNQAASRALEEVYRASGDHAALARALRAKLVGTSGGARAEVLAELGRLYAGPLDQPLEALEVLGEVYRDAPTPQLREKLEELAARADAFASLVQVLEGGLDKIADDFDRVQALHSLAALYEGARDAPLEALRIHRRILALRPNEERAKQALERLLQAAAATTDKLSFYREQVEAASSDTERVSIMLKLAHELVETAKDYVRAIDVYREILRLDPACTAALDALLALYRRDNRWAELAEALTLRIEKTPKGANRTKYQLELAKILDQILGQTERAVDWYCLALRDSPSASDAVPVAVSALEKLLPRAKNVVKVAELLFPIFSSRGQWDRAADMLEIRVKSLQDASARAEMLRNLAALYGGRLGQTQDALGALLRAFQADPADAGLQVELERTAAKANDLASLVRAYRSMASTLEGPERLRLTMRAAALAEQDGDLVGAALDNLRIFASSEHSAPGALAALERLAGRGLDARKFSEPAAEVAAALEPPQRVGYWRRIARFYEQVMRSPNDAIAAWKSVLNLEDNDAEAAKELDRLLDTAADPAELATHLRTKLARATIDAEVAATGMRLVDVLATKLQDPAGAIAELRQLGERCPAERAVWQRLSELESSVGNPRGAADAIQREIKLLTEGPDRRARLVTYADLLASELANVDGALEALQGVVTEEPAHAGAVAVLEELYAGETEHAVRERIGGMLKTAYVAAGRWADVAKLVADAAAAAGEPKARAALLRELAGLKSGKLDDHEGAFTELERAFRETPGDAELRLELERVAERAKAWEQLVGAYTAALGVLTDAEQQKPLRRKLASVLETKLGRAAEALEHYRAATGGGLPDDLPSLEAMERLLRSEQRLPELADVLGAIAERVAQDDPARRKALWTELAQLAEQNLNDKPRAIDAYRQVVAIDPNHIESLRHLERLLGELAQPEERAKVLGQLVGLGAINLELVNDLVKQAQVAMQLERFDEALTAYRAVLMKKRDHAEAVLGLEALIELAPKRLEIAQVLEPVYTAKQDHAKLAWVLEAKLDETPDLQQKKSLLRRIGDIYENRLGQKDRAFAMARRSLGEDPGDMGVRMWIEKLAGETGALAALADAYVEEARKADAQLKLQFHRRAAAIYHEKLNDVSNAVVEYQSILELEPRDEKALTGLETIFRSTQSFSDLVGLLRRRLALTAGMERKREYLAEIASLQAEKLEALAAGVDTYREILALTPEDTHAFSEIERLLGRLADWKALDAFYQEAIATLAEKRGRDVGARRIDLAYRRARIVDEQFADHEAAAQLFDAILVEAPEHAATLEYLEAKAAKASPEAVALLEKHYRAQKRWQKYVDLLEAKLADTPETSARREIYLAMATVYHEQLHVSDMAFLALTRAYNEDRANSELVDALEALAAKLDNWDELIEVIGVELDALPDPALRQRLLLRSGRIASERLKDVERATQYFQTALQYNPNDAEALAELDRMLEHNQKWAALADLIERRIDLAPDKTTKGKLLERLAVVWGEKLHDAEAALRCHKQILEIDPDHPLTLRQMQKLYEELQDWDALARNLAKQAEVMLGDADQVRIHAAAGELFANELGDMAAAIDHWQKVVAIEPLHEAGNQALLVLLTSEERWEELAALYQRQLAHTPDAGEKAEINRRLGVILGEKLGRSDDALVSWLEVLRTDAKNLDALRALLHLYEERAKWDEFVDIARRLIPLVEPAEAKEVKYRLARALGESLGKREEAIKLAREVRATEPHTADFLAKLAEMLTHIEAWDEAVLALEKAASLSQDVAQKVERYFAAAVMHAEKLAKPNDARPAYEAIRQVRPEDERAYTSLAQIYRDTAEWRKLVALNEDFVAHAAADQRLPILTEIRDVQNEKLGEKDLAFIAAGRVYKENPSDLAAAEVLERIGVETDMADALAGVLEDELDHVVDRDTKIASHRRLARIYADHVNDVAAAEGQLELILALAPDDLEALDSLAALGARQERFDKQIRALEQKLTHVQEDTVRKAILFDIAHIYEDRVSDVDEALTSLNRVLEIDGADVNALNELARLFAQESRWPDLARTLTRKVELTQDARESIDLRIQVATLCEGELADAESAIQWYRGVLDFEVGHAGALAALERLYTGLERWSELISVFELQLVQAAEVEEQIRILTKMAAIYESEFDSMKDAAATFERVLVIDPNHLPTIKSLERLLRALSEWNRLIEVLTKHISLIQDNNEITELYLQIGEIYYRELSRVDKAEETYNTARKFNPDSVAALNALGKLYERSGNWFQSLEMLQKEADALGKDPKALPILLRIGRINEEMLLDTSAARTAYERALSLDPNHGPALRALREIARGAEDWDKYAEYVITEAETADDPEEKTELFHEAAKFFLTIRDDELSAIRFFTRALEFTPNHMASARELADICFRNEEWQRAGELYRIVVEQLDKAKEPKEFCQKCYRLGYVSEKLGERERALAFYQQAVEADATYLPALEGSGQALLAAEKWDEAHKVFQTILIHHRDSLTESEIVDIQYQLGDICLKQRQPDRAYKQFEKALEIDTDHAPSLRAIAALDEQMENWHGAYERLNRLAEVVTGEDRGAVLVRLSEIAKTRLADTGRSVEALERARRAGVASTDVLEKLATTHLAAGQPQRASEVFEEAIVGATDPAKRSELCFSLGQLLERELKNEPAAVQRYNAALDAQPTNVKAFEAVERILAARKEWALLEANYRAMIARLKDLKDINPAVRLVLWRNLAELYRQVLRSVDHAIMAYEVVRKLDPGKPADAAVLADLYGQKPEHRAKAIAMLHEMLPSLENPVEPMRKLRKLYHADKRFDAVYALCAALANLRVADDEERKIFEYLQQGVPARSTQGMLEDQWPTLLHPDAAGPIGQLAAMLYRVAPDLVTVPAKDLGLKKKDFIDVRQSELYFASLVRYGMKVLGVSGLDLVKKSGSMEPLRLINAQPPALLAGESHEIWRETNERLVRFHIGRNLAYARPELFLARIYPGDELRDLLYGLCVVYNRGLAHSGSPRDVERWAEKLETMNPQGLKRLQPLARDVYPLLAQGRPLTQYGAAVELTAARAGLLVAGDLGTALRGITEGGEGASSIPVKQRAKELVLFAVSQQYLALRAATGGALVAGQGG